MSSSENRSSSSSRSSFQKMLDLEKRNKVDRRRLHTSSNSERNSPTQTTFYKDQVPNNGYLAPPQHQALPTSAKQKPTMSRSKTAPALNIDIPPHFKHPEHDTTQGNDDDDISVASICNSPAWPDAEKKEMEKKKRQDVKEKQKEKERIEKELRAEKRKSKLKKAPPLSQRFSKLERSTSEPPTVRSSIDFSTMDSARKGSIDVGLSEWMKATNAIPVTWNKAQESSKKEKKKSAFIGGLSLKLEQAVETVKTPGENPETAEQTAKSAMAQIEDSNVPDISKHPIYASMKAETAEMNRRASLALPSPTFPFPKEARSNRSSVHGYPNVIEGTKSSGGATLGPSSPRYYGDMPSQVNLTPAESHQSTPGSSQKSRDNSIGAEIERGRTVNACVASRHSHSRSRSHKKLDDDVASLKVPQAAKSTKDSRPIPAKRESTTGEFFNFLKPKPWGRSKESSPSPTVTSEAKPVKGFRAIPYDGPNVNPTGASLQKKTSSHSLNRQNSSMKALKNAFSRSSITPSMIGNAISTPPASDGAGSPTKSFSFAPSVASSSGLSLPAKVFEENSGPSKFTENLATPLHTPSSETFELPSKAAFLFGLQHGEAASPNFEQSVKKVRIKQSVDSSEDLDEDLLIPTPANSRPQSFEYFPPSTHGAKQTPEKERRETAGSYHSSTSKSRSPHPKNTRDSSQDSWSRSARSLDQSEEEPPHKQLNPMGSSGSSQSLDVPSDEKRTSKTRRRSNLQKQLSLSRSSLELKREPKPREDETLEEELEKRLSTTARQEKRKSDRKGKSSSALTSPGFLSPKNSPSGQYLRDARMSLPSLSKSLPSSSPSSPSSSFPDQGKPMAKMFVVCCGCKYFHDMPSKIYECMAKPDNLVRDQERGVSAVVSTAVKCPWCGHGMRTSCCEGYAAVVCLKERLH